MIAESSELLKHSDEVRSGRTNVRNASFFNICRCGFEVAMKEAEGA